MQKERNTGNILLLILFSCLAGVYLLLSMQIAEGGQETYASPDNFARFVCSRLETASLMNILTAIAAAALLSTVSICCYLGRTKLLRRLHQYRYLLAVSLILFLTVFRINNTSLYQWTEYLGLKGAEAYKPLWGVTRGIRADEWSVWSPLAFSQQYTGYSASNNVLAGLGADPTWISVGGVPAFSPAAVFKPFYWGFLLFGTSIGYSFLFACRTILLFLISYELAEQYTGKKHSLSAAAATMITFSPYVQWWFSQSIAEVLIFGQGIVLFFLLSLKSADGKHRILHAAAFCYCIGCFLMVGYPSWLVSTAWLILPICIVTAVKKKRQNGGKKPLAGLPMILCAGLTAILLGVILWQSRETLAAVKNSVYPGERLMTGGGQTEKILTDLYSAFYSFLQPLGANACEGASWITFAPAGMLISLHLMYRSRKRDSISIVLMAAELVFGWFAVFGIPEWLARITLLSQVNRPELVIGIADTILLIRGLSQKEEMSPRSIAALAVLFTTVHVLFLCASSGADETLFTILTGIYLSIYLMLFLCDAKKHQTIRYASCALVILSLMGGGFVNPLQQGKECIDRLHIIQAMKETGTEEDLWFVDGSYPMTNLPLFAGKRVVDSTQVYANTERWKSLDPDETWRNEYNRFANLSGQITGEKTGFTLISPDHVLLSVRLSDLIRMNVRYILTARALEEEGTAFRLERETDNLYIYRIQ